jgi:hypothetical protein
MKRRVGEDTRRNCFPGPHGTDIEHEEVTDDGG